VVGEITGVESVVVVGGTRGLGVVEGCLFLENLHVVLDNIAGSTTSEGLKPLP